MWQINTIFHLNDYLAKKIDVTLSEDRQSEVIVKCSNWRPIFAGNGSTQTDITRSL